MIEHGPLVGQTLLALVDAILQISWALAPVAPYVLEFVRATAEMIAATGAACVEKPFDLGRLEALVRETAVRATAGSRAAR